MCACESYPNRVNVSLYFICLLFFCLLPTFTYCADQHSRTIQFSCCAPWLLHCSRTLTNQSATKKKIRLSRAPPFHHHHYTELITASSGIQCIHSRTSKRTLTHNTTPRNTTPPHTTHTYSHLEFITTTKLDLSQHLQASMPTHTQHTHKQSHNKCIQANALLHTTPSLPNHTYIFAHIFMKINGHIRTTMHTHVHMHLFQSYAPRHLKIVNTCL